MGGVLAIDHGEAKSGFAVVDAARILRVPLAPVRLPGESRELLEHVATPAVAHEMLLSGEPKKGSWLAARGVFNDVLPRAEVMPRALAVARRIADKPRLSLELLRRALTLPRRRAFETTYTMESMMHRLSFAQPDVLALIEEHHASLSAAGRAGAGDAAAAGGPSGSPGEPGLQST